MNNVWITKWININWVKYFFLISCSHYFCPLSSSAELLASWDVSSETHKSSTAQSKPHKTSKTSQCEVLPPSHSAINSSSSHLHTSWLPTHWRPSFCCLSFTPISREGEVIFNHSVLGLCWVLLISRSPLGQLQSADWDLSQFSWPLEDAQIYSLSTISHMGTCLTHTYMPSSLLLPPTLLT